MYEIIENPIKSSDYLEHVQDEAHGAIVEFQGVVRNHHNGRPVEKIFYECYQKMTLVQMGKIESETLEKYPDVKIVLVHRVGMVLLKEASILVLTGSPHRKDAYEASIYIMNRVKELLPIWKKEYHPGGEQSWVNIGS